MAKKFYVLDEQGTIMSTDGTRRFTLLEGEELNNYLNSEEGKKKYFVKQYVSKNEILAVEVPSEYISQFENERARRKYIKKVMEELDISITGFDIHISEEGEVSGEELIADDSPSVEERVIEKCEIANLRMALSQLETNEYELIYNLFLKKEPITERQYAAKKGLPKTTVHDDKIRILAKIKKFL